MIQYKEYRFDNMLAVRWAVFFDSLVLQLELASRMERETSKS